MLVVLFYLVIVKVMSVMYCNLVYNWLVELLVGEVVMLCFKFVVMFCEVVGIIFNEYFMEICIN